MIDVQCTTMHSNVMQVSNAVRFAIKEMWNRKKCHWMQIADEKKKRNRKQKKRNTEYGRREKVKATIEW